MTRIQTTKGACAFCGHKMARGAMSKHLATCPERQAQIDKAEATGRKPQTLYQLAVRDKEFTAFWLLLEVNGAAPLADLDTYLRAIWVDCCDHMSFFTIAGTMYRDLIDDKFTLRGEKSRQTPVGEAFVAGSKPGAYEYDFAAPSKLTLEVVEKREGKPLSRHPVALLARNVIPDFKCAECGESAKWMCVQCYYERGEEKCYLCAAHGKGHACTLYGGLRKVRNSPRLGRCKYNGPAKPPY